MYTAWNILWIFLIVSAACCAIGFKKFVYFLSVGYGFSVFGLGVAYIVTSFINGTWDIIGIIQCILFMVYGFRLSFFLLKREIKNANYRKVLKEATKDGEKKMPIFVLATIWVMVAIMYYMQTSPVFYRQYNAYLDGAALGNGLIDYSQIVQFGHLDATDWTKQIAPIIGIVLSVTGIILEALADRQKSAQKKVNPHMVATQGLYKMVRCPNYFGEITFWTGVFVSGVTALHGPGQWIIGAVGYVLIVYVMINGAQRLDARQEKNYGTMEEYRAYADHTPIIFPLLPIYHIGDYKGEKKAKKEAAKKEEEQK